MSVAQIAAERALEAGARRTISVTVEVGELSGVMPEALEFCYAAAAMGGLAEGSRLVISRIPAVAVCGECGETFTPDQPVFVCPRCDGLTSSLQSGEELAVIEIEVE